MMVEQEPKFSPILPLPAIYNFISLCIKYAIILEAFFPSLSQLYPSLSQSMREASLTERCACSEKKIGCQKMHAWLGQENKMHFLINLVIFFDQLHNKCLKDVSNILRQFIVDKMSNGFIFAIREVQ
jgi:hypothetical protein